MNRATIVYDAAHLLLECVCTGLDATEKGCPERRCVVPNNAPERTNCCANEGQLTVNLTSTYPSRQFPTPDGGSPSNCDAPYQVVNYSIEVLRCMPVGTVDRAPTCDELDQVAYTTMLDVQAMRQGVYCCLEEDKESTWNVLGQGYRWMFGDHLPIELDAGGCAGTTMQILIGYMTCWECP